MLNAFHETDAANSHAWGLALAGPIELAMCAVAQVRQISAADACAIAEAIIENGGGEDAHRDADALYAGALEGSPRYALANLEWIKQRSAQIGRAA